MTPPQLQILQHSLGVDQYGRGRQYRDHFAAGGEDVQICQELIALGYMRQVATTDPVFPVSMSKPEIIAATNAAMEGKFFDEIRLFPFTKRRGDPCILGSIYNPREARRLYFMISWRINRADL